MAAYMLFSLPLVSLILAALRRSADGRFHAFSDTPGAIVRSYAYGLVAGFPALLLVGALRPALEGSYRLGRLFAEALLVDHLAALVIAAGGAALLMLLPVLGWGARPSFAQGLSYLAGCFTVLEAADYLANRRELTVHILFLVPTLRVVTACIYARALERVGESRGGPGWITISVMVALPALLALEGVWARQGRIGAAVLVTAALAALTLLGLGLRTTGGEAPSRAAP